MPTVSVLMCVFNSEAFLSQSIESILNQSFESFEFIIVDDCSIDGSYELCQKYAVSDPRIILVRNEVNIGLTRSLNKGLRIAKGQLIARLDADDVSRFDRLDIQVDYLRNRPNTVLVGSSALRIDSSAKKTGQYNFEPKDHPEIVSRLLSFEAFCPHSSWMFRKQIAGRQLFYDPFFVYSQDYAFLLNLLYLQVGEFGFIEESLIELRMHGASITNTEKSLEQSLYAVLARYLYSASQMNMSSDLKKKEFLILKEIADAKRLDQALRCYRQLVLAATNFKGRRLSDCIYSLLKALCISPHTFFYPFRAKNLKLEVLKDRLTYSQ